MSRVRLEWFGWRSSELQRCKQGDSGGVASHNEAGAKKRKGSFGRRFEHAYFPRSSRKT